MVAFVLDECAAVLRDLILNHDLVKRIVDCCAIEELPDGCRDTLRDQAAAVAEYRGVSVSRDWLLRCSWPYSVAIL